MNQRIFVLVKGLDYKRYIEKSMTNHIIADSALSPEHIEIFRTNPLTFLTANEPGPEPEAA